MAKLIGTAGHVDHGKTTLIKALTGIDADRLPEEKRRGMTIDIGFAYVDLPRHGRVSIVDVPGHEKFLTNMLVGALGIDVALLCVSADESVMPQTREHLQILELLPVEKLIVAMTRADLADDETREFAAEEISELVAGTRFQTATIVPVSAFTGEGVEALKGALASALDESQEPPRGPWYLPVDRVFAVKGHGCVVTGTLAQGRAKVGDRAFLEPGHVEVRVRAIHSHEEALDESERGKRTALNLSGVKMEDVRRGMAIGEPGALFETTIFDAKVRWIEPPKHGLRVRVSVGAEEGIGRLFLSDQEPELAQVRLESPLACALNQPVILRRYSPPDLLGGGRIVVPQAKPRRKSEEVSLLSGEGDDASAILEVLHGKPNGVPTEEICRVLGKTPQALGSVFEQLQRDGQAIGFAGLWFTPDAFAEGADRLKASLLKLHEQFPTQSAQARERVVSGAGLKWAGKPLDRIVAHLAAEGTVVAVGTTLRDPGFSLQLSPRQRSFLDRAVASLDKAGINVPSAHDLASEFAVPYQATEEILRLGVEAGELVRVEEGIYYTRSQMETIKNTVREVSGGKPFSASQFRDAVGTSRKYAIPLLEYLDGIRFTMRIGDNRVVKEGQ